jgi:hypothetical protein
MIVPIFAIAAMSAGEVPHLGPGNPNRPIATIAPYPYGMADDVRRPGYNGRLWVSRPILGAIQQGPYPEGWQAPGPEAYGAFNNQDATTYVRIAHLVVGITPWVGVNKQGLQTYENARQFWLQEQGYTGGVRTFVNDLYLWVPDAKGQEEASAEVHGGPRATIQLPADMPRQRRRLRVDAGGAAGRDIPLVCPGAGPMRVSWPMTASADAVARTAADGGFILDHPATRVITSAR